MGNMILGNSNTKFKVGSGDCSIYLGTTLLYSPTQPVFDGKWLARYSDSHTESGACDESSFINPGDIELENLVSVEIGSCVRYISSDAFGCDSLTSVTIPDSVTFIGDSAFSGCRSLTSITIPSGVTIVDNWAFDGCESLTSITINATTPPSIGPDTFRTRNNCPIYVPAASVSAYQSAWSAYSSRITAIPNS